MDKVYEVLLMNYDPRTSKSFLEQEGTVMSLKQLLNSVILDLDSAISLFMGMEEEEEIVFSIKEEESSMYIVFNEGINIEELFYDEEENEDASIWV